jgi:hypothetical protein
MVDICLDLGVVPGFWTGAFWNHLFEIIQCIGGSLGTLMRERARRGDAFAQQPESNWDWRDLGRTRSARSSASSSAKHRSIHSPSHQHRTPRPPAPLTHRR